MVFYSPTLRDTFRAQPDKAFIVNYRRPPSAGKIQQIVFPILGILTLIGSITLLATIGQKFMPFTAQLSMGISMGILSGVCLTLFGARIHIHRVLPRLNQDRDPGITLNKWLQSPLTVSLLKAEDFSSSAYTTDNILFLAKLFKSYIPSPANPFGIPRAEGVFLKIEQELAWRALDMKPEEIKNTLFGLISYSVGDRSPYGALCEYLYNL